MVDKNQIRARNRATSQIKDNLNKLQAAVLTRPYDIPTLNLLAHATETCLAILATAPREDR